MQTARRPPAATAAAACDALTGQGATLGAGDPGVLGGSTLPACGPLTLPCGKRSLVVLVVGFIGASPASLRRAPPVERTPRVHVATFFRGSSLDWLAHPQNPHPPFLDPACVRYFTYPPSYTLATFLLRHVPPSPAISSSLADLPDHCTRDAGASFCRATRRSFFSLATDNRGESERNRSQATTQAAYLHPVQDFGTGKRIVVRIRPHSANSISRSHLANCRDSKRALAQHAHVMY